MGIELMLLLGALTAVDSMGIDMYLPAFSAIQSALNTNAAMLQISLSIFLIGIAIGQAVAGPLLDSFGRKRPLLIGVLLFAGASAMVALAPGTGLFLAGRFIQGLGCAAGLVIPRAIVSDLCDIKQSTRIYSILMQIMSVAPIAAPPLGGVLLLFFGWKAIFWILAAIGLVLAAVSFARLPETLPKESRTVFSFMGALKTYLHLFKSRRYLNVTLSASLLMATLFAYISGSPFLFMEYYGLSAGAYSILFAVNALGMILFGQLQIFLYTRMDPYRLLLLGFMLHLLFIGLIGASVAADFHNITLMAALLFFAMSCTSLIFGGITAEIMFSVPHTQRGSASALLGVLQYTFGGLAGVLLGFLHDGTPWPFALILGCCSLLSVVMWSTRAKKI